MSKTRNCLVALGIAIAFLVATNVQAGMLTYTDFVAGETGGIENSKWTLVESTPFGATATMTRVQLSDWDYSLPATYSLQVIVNKQDLGAPGNWGVNPVMPQIPTANWNGTMPFPGFPQVSLSGNGGGASDPYEPWLTFLQLDTDPLDTWVFAVYQNNNLVAWYGDAATVAASEAAVPEPATLAVLGLGLAGLGLARRRMKK